MSTFNFSFVCTALLPAVVGLYSSCGNFDTNETHRKWIIEGEKKYATKIYNLRLQSGKYRLKLNLVLQDAFDATTIVLTCNNNVKKYTKQWKLVYTPSQNIYEATLNTEDEKNPYYIRDTIEYILDKIQERGVYTIGAQTMNKFGDLSLPKKNNVYVYDSLYAKTMSPVYVEITYYNSDNKAEIKWKKQNLYLTKSSELKYTSASGEEKTVALKITEDSLFRGQKTLNDIDVQKKVLYRTYYIPNIFCIDSFPTDWNTIPDMNIEFGKNY